LPNCIFHVYSKSTLFDFTVCPTGFSRLPISIQFVSVCWVRFASNTKPKIMEIKQKEFESYWCKKDVARILSVSTRKIEKMMEDGLIPYLKIGGSVRFIPEKVREFVETKYKGNSKGLSGDSRRLQ
jgi:excisionase family DNA binding protein